jgi:EAL domain-containing protein (putative c-di-GMP-specific phosphodiesterase class I)
MCWNHPRLGPCPVRRLHPAAEGEQHGALHHHRGGQSRAYWPRGIDRFPDRLRSSDQRCGGHLVENNIAPRIADAIRRFGVDPAQVGLEISEGTFVRDGPRVRGTVTELAKIGLGISIDASSALQYLRHISANVLKIDQSFIRSQGTSARDAIIVRSMIDLVHALRYRVLADETEDGGAMAMLTEWNCDDGQGYFAARPAPVDTMKPWVAARGGGGRVNPR